tara:strand:- start:41 stop:283 length:243 start_codon:yes stop_codon:yes gene_type:complete
MALNKEQKVVGIEILEDDSVKVSIKVIVKDGDEFIAEKKDYYILQQYVPSEPSSEEDEPVATDISGEDAKVQSVCNIAWA